MRDKLNTKPTVANDSNLEYNELVCAETFSFEMILRVKKIINNMYNIL